MAKITLGALYDAMKKVADAVTGNRMQADVKSSVLPDGAASSAKQDEQTAALVAIASKDSATAAKQDAQLNTLGAINAATGKADDAEATGDGTVIGVLKRIRTLLGDAIVTLGAAIGTKARLIAGSDGVNARAIKTTADGTVVTQLTGSNLADAQAIPVKQVDTSFITDFISTPTVLTAGSSMTVGSGNRRFRGRRLGIGVRWASSIKFSVVVSPFNATGGTSVGQSTTLIDVTSDRGSVLYEMQQKYTDISIRNADVVDGTINRLSITDFLT